MADLWTSADAYDAYMGRWSLAIARQFVPWLGVGDGKSWLDVGCGTGALTQAILEAANPSKVIGLDASEAFNARARATITNPRVSFVRADAQQLPPLGEFDAVVSGLLLNFLPDPAVALTHMAQATYDGGTVGAYVWDYAEQMELMRYFWDAASELDPSAEALDEGRRASICHTDALVALMAAELSDVKVTELVVPTHFETFDAYWRPFLGGVGSAPTYAMSLDEEHRTALRERLRVRLPVATDGSIALKARAWAVKGLR